MKIVLIAGAGELPEVFVKNVKSKKDEIFIIGAKDITTIQADVLLPIGKISKLIDIIKTQKPDGIVMLGKFEHKLALDPRYYDIKAISILTSLKDKRPLTIIKAFIELLEKEGLTFIDPRPYLEGLLIKNPGILNEIEPTNEELEDIHFGIDIAKQIANLDIGQTVVVKQKAIVAIEAMEGTNKTILRAGEIAGKNCVIIKSARTNQDFRIDVPTVGLHTLDIAKSIKAKAIAIEKEKVYVLEKEKFLKTANRFGICIYAYE